MLFFHHGLRKDDTDFRYKSNIDQGQAYFSDDLFVLAIKQYVNLNFVPAFIVIYI